MDCAHVPEVSGHRVGKEVASMIERFFYKTQVIDTDIDALNHANNLCYIRWMQEAATAHSTENGWPEARYQQAGYGWVVRRHEITYLESAKLNDEIGIETWVSDIKRASSTRQFRIRSNDRLLAEAQTNWAFINYATLRLMKIPDEVRNCFVALG